MLNNSFVYIRNNYKQKLRHVTNLNINRLKDITGFSLFEFTLVLIIVSTLVSISIPKLMEFKVGAHKSNVQLSANSLRSAVNLVHTLWQSKGSKDRVVIVKRSDESPVTEFTALIGVRGWPIDIIDHDVSNNSYMPERDLMSLSSFTCERLWNGLLKNSTSSIALEMDKKVNTGTNEADKEFIATFQSEFHQGVCRFRYLLGEDDFRIEYDPETGHVNTFF